MPVLRLADAMLGVLQPAPHLSPGVALLDGPQERCDTCRELVLEAVMPPSVNRNETGTRGFANGRFL